MFLVSGSLAIWALRQNQRRGGTVMSSPTVATWEPDRVRLENAHEYACRLQEALRPSLTESTQRKRRHDATIWLKLLERELNPTCLPPERQGPFRGPPAVREALQDLRDICQLLADQWGLSDLWRGELQPAPEPLSLTDPTTDVSDMLIGVIERLERAIEAVRAAPYQPHWRQPQTLGQLLQYAAASQMSARDNNVPPPVDLDTSGVPGLGAVLGFCQVESGLKLRPEVVLHMRDRFAQVCRTTITEADDTSLEAVAAALHHLYAASERPPADTSAMPQTSFDGALISATAISGSPHTQVDVQTLQSAHLPPRCTTLTSSDLPATLVELREWLADRVRWLRDWHLAPDPKPMEPGLVNAIVCMFGNTPLGLPKDRARILQWASERIWRFSELTIQHAHGCLERLGVLSAPAWHSPNPETNSRAMIEAFDHLAGLMPFVAQITAADPREALASTSGTPPASRRKAASSQKPIRDKKLDARDKWIYQHCNKGTPHDVIVAELKRIAAERGWRIVSTKQRIQQIGIEYAQNNSVEPPPPRKNL
jgi:hypothetical protein